jgi:hypothetical protein
MDILGRESFAFADHTNANLVAGTGYAARERDQFKELISPGTRPGNTVAEDS